MTSDKNDPKTAHRFLAEAFDTVAGKAANYQRLQTQLQVAQDYAPFDPDCSFEIMTRIINQPNDLMTTGSRTRSCRFRPRHVSRRPVATKRSPTQGAAHDCADCLIQHELYSGVEHETAELTGYGQREITVAL
jgi:hypothetical protein